MAQADSNPFLLRVSAPGEATRVPAAELRPGDRLNGAFNVSYVNASARVPWINKGGDWTDRTGVAQATASPFASLTSPRDDQVKPLSFTSASLTTLCESFRNGALENWGLFLRMNPASTAAMLVYSRNAAVPDTSKPHLILTLQGGGSQTVQCSADSAWSNYTTPRATEANVHLGDQPCYFYFDLSRVGTPITAATLRLTTTGQTFGSGNMVCDVLRVDLSRHQGNPVAKQAGLAANYMRDLGIETHPDVLMVERFQDANFRSRGWVIPDVNGQDSGIVAGPTDPADPAASYAPLYPGATAWRSKINSFASGRGTVGTAMTWPFYANRGPIFSNPRNPGNPHEPDEIYIRCYIRHGDNYNPGDQGGKQLVGCFDGRYIMPSSGTGLAGRPYLKPNAPTAAGNGGSPSNGVSGWSIRSQWWFPVAGGIPNAEDDPLYAAGWRTMNSYVYWPGQTTYGGDEGGPAATGSEFSWHLRGANKTGGLFRKNRWYSIEMHCSLNSIQSGGTVNIGDRSGGYYRTATEALRSSDTAIVVTSTIGGVAIDGTPNQDGILEVWVDGRKITSQTNMVWRYKWGVQILGVWLNHISGGQPQNCLFTGSMYIANLVAAKSYIGPIGG